ncbi:hypothetical protein SEA_IDYN_60 [Gordonia phage IDyn]|uniref:Uncharacterized protein n=1 Tax=Gordonia phage IDyn TaxID=2510506 RepID=A0A411CU90_9CAUD|nr:hypothetical protein KNU47_gp60 [Gordonia phage IDyn]QAY17408.1 hypothetical protein SEA_IDYN_60 [Gordonia phage IDyn]
MAQHERTGKSGEYIIVPAPRDTEYVGRHRAPTIVTRFRDPQAALNALAVQSKLRVLRG